MWVRKKRNSSEMQEMQNAFSGQVGGGGHSRSAWKLPLGQLFGTFAEFVSAWKLPGPVRTVAYPARTVRKSLRTYSHHSRKDKNSQNMCCLDGNVIFIRCNGTPF